MTATKPTIRELRAEAQRMGITAESCGNAVEELLRLARDNEDPLGYLAIHAPSPPQPPLETEITQTDPCPLTPDPSLDVICEPIGDVPAPLPVGKQEISPQSPIPNPCVLTVPVARPDLDNCYISRHCEVRLSPQQARTLRCVLLGLDAAGERLSNGRRVATPADALRWLLEKIGIGD
jgi:hypothetical protein